VKGLEELASSNRVLGGATPYVYLSPYSLILARLEHFVKLVRSKSKPSLSNYERSTENCSAKEELQKHYSMNIFLTMRITETCESVTKTLKL
jgi:hypothetical protein